MHVEVRDTLTVE